MNKNEVPIKITHRNKHHSRAMGINLNIIIDNTLVRKTKTLKNFIYKLYIYGLAVPVIYITGDITLKQKYGKPQKG